MTIAMISRVSAVRVRPMQTASNPRATTAARHGPKTAGTGNTDAGRAPKIHALCARNTPESTPARAALIMARRLLRDTQPLDNRQGTTPRPAPSPHPNARYHRGMTLPRVAEIQEFYIVLKPSDIFIFCRHRHIIPSRLYYLLIAHTELRREKEQNPRLEKNMGSINRASAIVQQL